MNDRVRDLLNALAEGRCPHCRELVNGKQVGRCVYCEKCGARMYQGRVRRARGEGINTSNAITRKPFVPKSQA